MATTKRTQQRGAAMPGTKRAAAGRGPRGATGGVKGAGAIDALATYRAMRDPTKTLEPMGSPRGSRRQRSLRPKFVVQEHHARSLHWDFRLEHDGVLVSWALPKGVPTDPETNHLAVRTEDHPLDYGNFAGEIPAGQYGAGQVTIWDRGEYELEKWTDDEVKVVLHGERASGRFVLFPTGGKRWLIHRVRPTELPRAVRPMLAQAGGLPEDSSAWAFEFKWDGIRAITAVGGGRMRIVSRNDRELGPAFPELTDIVGQLRDRSAVLDGEIVALDDQGRPSFSLLQHRLHVASAREADRRAAEAPATYLVFDLLVLDGRQFVERPYDERRGALEALGLAGAHLATPAAFRDLSASEMLRAARDAGLEGIVAKRRASPYRPGERGPDWVKIKNFRTQEVVGGWTEGAGSRAHSVGALLLGLPAPGGLAYVGKVGTGFGIQARRELLELLAPLARDDSPFVTGLGRNRQPAHFVEPEIVGEVQFAEWTGDGHLRHPSWRGLRDDKSAGEVVRES